MNSPSPVYWHRILAAFMFATRLRLPYFDQIEPAAHRSFRPFMPLVGLFVGAVGVLVFAVADTVLHTTSIAVVLSMSATILLTGALHEDGLADSCDAFGGHVTRAKALTIMKDSRLGTYGMCGLFLVLLLKYLALTSIAQAGSVWVFTVVYLAAHTASRCLAIRTSWQLQYAAAPDTSKSEPVVSDTPTHKDKLICLGLAAIPLLVLGAIQISLLFGALGLAVICTWRMQAVSQQRIQGYTGDVLGAVQQVSELGFYLGALVFLVPVK